MKSLITNIQRMCFDDGPGIRTTVFMKGCSIHCPWCSNPENISFESEKYFISDDCVLNHSKCDYEGCRYYDLFCGAAGEYGKECSYDDLMQILLSDKTYYDETGGGVTFSGGEPLMHHEYLKNVMHRLKEENVHMAVETALFVPALHVKSVLDYIDFFYIDVKILVPDMCKDVLGGNVRWFSENVNCIVKSKKEVVFRVPCNDEYTLTKSNIIELLAFFADNRDIPIELFKTHSLGEKKYRSLGAVFPGKLSCSDESIDSFGELLSRQGNDVRIRRL